MKTVDFSIAYPKAHLPAKIALAVTQKPDGKYNLITLEWFMRTSSQPAMFAISIGHFRYSHVCLDENRFFNLVFPSAEMRSICSFSGSHSGKDTDKFLELQLPYIPGRYKKLPVPSDAVAVFECEVISQIRSGDHTIYIGEVKYSWANEGKELLVYQKKI